MSSVSITSSLLRCRQLLNYFRQPFSLDSPTTISTATAASRTPAISGFNAGISRTMAVCWQQGGDVFFLLLGVRRLFWQHRIAIVT